MWFRLSDFPSGEGSHCLFGVHMPLHVLLKLPLRKDGKLELILSSNEKPAVFTTSSIRKSCWTHTALVHYPHRGPNPNIRESSLILLSCNTAMCVGPKYAYTSLVAILTCQIPDELPRLVHHLGPLRLTLIHALDINL